VSGIPIRKFLASMKPSPTSQIPWAKPVFWGREQAYVADALTSTWISGGTYIDRLECEIAEFCDVPHALAVANGTAAIHLCYLALGLGAGDEIVVPGFGYLAAANVALQVGATPVFAEVDSATWCVTAETIARVMTSRTRAVVPIHTYGNACEMDAIIALCAARGVLVIEDAAESFGTRYHRRQTGTLGDLGCFSFQATKTITTGEGGMVVTRRGELVQPLQLYRSHGVLRTRYVHEVAGLNFRLTNMQAAMGCAQLEQMQVIVEARRRMREWYCRFLENLDGVVTQEFSPAADPVVWAIAVKLDPDAFPQGRDAVIDQLAQSGIESRPGFYPPNAMPNLYGNGIDLPVCTAIARQVISLPSYPSLTPEEIERVCATLKALRH
jgi:perosamine synthetase